MNTLSYFEIQSSNPAREAAFYHAVFGWKTEIDPTIPILYYRITGGGMGGGILQRPAAVPPSGTGTNAFCCSFQVESFDATTAIILNHGGQIALPKFAVTGKCWQGYFLDPDGNVFGLFEVDISAK